MYVYIMSSRSRTLYVGVTNDLRRRVYEHITNPIGFTGDYRIRRLVYYEEHQTPIVAIEREKRIKSLLRRRKIALIEEKNPAWDDLSKGWFVLPEEKARRKAGPPALRAIRMTTEKQVLRRFAPSG